MYDHEFFPQDVSHAGYPNHIVLILCRLEDARIRQRVYASQKWASVSVQHQQIEGRTPVLTRFIRFFEHCDSVLLSSSYVLEGEAMDAFKAWLSESKKEVYGVGPLLPANYWDAQSDGGATEVQVFLDSMLEIRGKKSVVLVRFLCVYCCTALMWLPRYPSVVMFGPRCRTT